MSLAEHHREHFGLSTDEAVAFNKDQRAVIVGQQVTPEIRQTASFLRSKGLSVTCVEFTFFQGGAGRQLLSEEIVVGKEVSKPRHVTSGSQALVTQDKFMDSLDDNGRVVFSRILQFARERGMPIQWGTRGFSLNVDVEGDNVAVCFGYPSEAVYKQSICTIFRRQGGMARKTAAPEDVLNHLLAQAESTGLFRQAGGELKCPIDRTFSEEQINSLLSWCETVAKAIRQYGIKE